MVAILLAVGGRNRRYESVDVRHCCSLLFNRFVRVTFANAEGHASHDRPEIRRHRCTHSIDEPRDRISTRPMKKQGSLWQSDSVEKYDLAYLDRAPRGLRV